MMRLLPLMRTASWLLLKSKIQYRNLNKQFLFAWCLGGYHSSVLIELLDAINRIYIILVKYHHMCT